MDYLIFIPIVFIAWHIFKKKVSKKVNSFLGLDWTEQDKINKEVK